MSNAQPVLHNFAVFHETVTYHPHVIEKTDEEPTYMIVAPTALDAAAILKKELGIPRLRVQGRGYRSTRTGRFAESDLPAYPRRSKKERETPMSDKEYPTYLFWWTLTEEGEDIPPAPGQPIFQKLR